MLVAFVGRVTEDLIGVTIFVGVEVTTCGRNTVPLCSLRVTYGFLTLACVGTLDTGRCVGEFPTSTCLFSVVIVPKLNVQLLMLRCPDANFENSLFSILEKVEAIIGTACGDGKAAGDSL